MIYQELMIVLLVVISIDDINDDGNGNNNGDGFGNDLPPKNSMYDLSNINGSGKGTRDKNGINSDSKFESFINKDPKHLIVFSINFKNLLNS